MKSRVYNKKRNMKFWDKTSVGHKKYAHLPDEALFESQITGQITPYQMYLGLASDDGGEEYLPNQGTFGDYVKNVGIKNVKMEYMQRPTRR